MRVPEQVRGGHRRDAGPAIEVTSRRLCTLLEEARRLDLEAVAEEVSVRAQRAVRKHLDRLPRDIFYAQLEVDGAPRDDPNSYLPIHLELRASLEDGETAPRLLGVRTHSNPGKRSMFPSPTP